VKNHASAEKKQRGNVRISRKIEESELISNTQGGKKIEQTGKREKKNRGKLRSVVWVGAKA